MASASALTTSARKARRRRRTAVVLTAGILALALGLTWAAGGSVVASIVPVDPGVADGVIPADQPATIDDTSLPAIARLDPALRDAVASAATAAAHEGLSLEIMSGWRSRAYQERLFADAVETYGSTEIAGEYVAVPDRSRHVTGNAVDIGPLEAQLWLMQHGARWGLCQIYANERWHFELATTPGGACPEMRRDASG